MGKGIQGAWVSVAISTTSRVAKASSRCTSRERSSYNTIPRVLLHTPTETHSCSNQHTPPAAATTNTTRNIPPHYDVGRTALLMFLWPPPATIPRLRGRCDVAGTRWLVGGSLTTAITGAFPRRGVAWGAGAASTAPSPAPSPVKVSYKPLSSLEVTSTISTGMRPLDTDEPDDDAASSTPSAGPRRLSSPPWPGREDPAVLPELTLEEGSSVLWSTPGHAPPPANNALPSGPRMRPLSSTTTRPTPARMPGWMPGPATNSPGRMRPDSSDHSSLSSAARAAAMR